jgi:valyl-tRNA synthetase
MIKSSVYENENKESIAYTLYTLGLGIIKLFAPFIPHITEEIYQQHYKAFEKHESIHIASWPEEIPVDKDAENSGELVKTYISRVRSIKSEQGIALNAPMKAFATYSTKSNISKIQPSGSIITSTLKLPKDHQFIEGKPAIEEKITAIIPVHAKIGPLFKKESKNIVKWIEKNKDELIRKIQKNGDIKWSDIAVADAKDPDECLIKNGYIQLKKESQIKGKKGRAVVQFDDFYIEVPEDMIK